MRRLPAYVTSMVAILLLAAPVAAAEPVVVTADLEGLPLSVEEVPAYLCHDLDFPQIHCFKNAAGLQEALAASEGDTLMAAAGSNYVIVYSQTSYAGSYLYISQDYDTLAVVGWNDRIRSYRGLNSELGRFWTDWFHSGAAMDFCCNSKMPSLSATFDQRITSVYRR